MSSRTERLAIEPLAVEHAEGLFGALDDVRVGRFIGGPDVTTVDALVERIDRLGRGAPAASGQTWLNWVVVLDAGADHVIGRIEATVHDGVAEMAYVFGPEWWGRGYANEATAWLLETLAERADVDQIWATVDPENTASIRLLERLGLRRSPLPASGLLSYDDGDVVYTTAARRPTAHLLCGLNGAGKTTLARELAQTLPAVCLSRDEWMIRLHGLAHDDPRYAERLEPCTELMWDVALSILATGLDVILDWNQWSRSHRIEAAARARSSGYDVVLHHVDVTFETAVQRAQQRFDAGTPNSHHITAESIAQFVTIYEPPTDDEGIRIEVHT